MGLGGVGRFQHSGGGLGVQGFGNSKVLGMGSGAKAGRFFHQESSDPRRLVPCHVVCSCVSVFVSDSFPVLSCMRYMYCMGCSTSVWCDVIRCDHVV